MLIVDFVWHTKIVEWREKFGFNSLEDIATKDKVFLTQRQQVTAIRSLGRRRETQEKSRREVLNECSISWSGGVMEFINHDVIKSIRGKVS